jgi:hypothetical protein
MTTPQDPNQPAQPGDAAPGDATPQGWGQAPQAPSPWGTAPSPDQPGWAAPQASNQPAWGAPPPAPSQPAWGAPPPAPGQPAWGAPPPAPGQPAWGAPPPAGPGWGAPPPAGQPGWSPQPGWGQPPNPNRSNRRGCLIALAVVLVVIVLGVGACTAFLLPYIQTEIKLQSDLGPSVSSISFDNTNGTVTWIIHLKAGSDSEIQARALACTVIRADLQGTQFANSHYELVDSDGYLVADENTPCP